MNETQNSACGAMFAARLGHHPVVEPFHARKSPTYTLDKACIDAADCLITPMTASTDLETLRKPKNELVKDKPPPPRGTQAGR